MRYSGILYVKILWNMFRMGRLNSVSVISSMLTTLVFLDLILNFQADSTYLCLIVWFLSDILWRPAREQFSRYSLEVFLKFIRKTVSILMFLTLGLYNLFLCSCHHTLFLRVLFMILIWAQYDHYSGVHLCDWHFK